MGEFLYLCNMSHLLQMRGLKLEDRRRSFYTRLSHLLQMRGLKQKNIENLNMERKVASFTDAWIETTEGMSTEQILESHLLQMRGLKQKTGRLGSGNLRRIFYRCVD